MTMKPNAKNRSRRLRKKLHVDEFAEYGFEVSIDLKDSVNTDAVLDHFVLHAMEQNGLEFGGGTASGAISGFITKSGRGTLTQEHRVLVKSWLEEQEDIKSFDIGGLVDAWYPESSPE